MRVEICVLEGFWGHRIISLYQKWDDEGPCQFLFILLTTSIRERVRDTQFKKKKKMELLYFIFIYLFILGHIFKASNARNRSLRAKEILYENYLIATKIKAPFW